MGRDDELGRFEDDELESNVARISFPGLGGWAGRETKTEDYCVGIHETARDGARRVVLGRSKIGYPGAHMKAIDKWCEKSEVRRRRAADGPFPNAEMEL